MSTSQPFAAEWCDGRRLASRPVTLSADGTNLHIDGLEAPCSIPLARVRASDRLARVPRFLYLPDGVSLATPDNDAVDALLASRGQARLNRLIDWLESRSRVAAIAAVLLVASVAGLVYFGLPAAARRAAQAVPANIERQAGEAALNTLSRMLGPSQLDRAARQRVATQMDRLVRAQKLPIAPRLEYRAMGNFPNAFALPGGILVVSDELVHLATDDELAAVLAHETAHWQLRHGAQTVFRSSAALLVVSTVTGDLSTLTGFTASLPLLLLQRGYSREFEEEADAYAVAALKQAGIDPRHLAAVLTKLQRARPDTGVDYSYLSTHPSTDDRARKIDPTNSYLSLIPAPNGQKIVTAATDDVTAMENVDVAPRALTQELPEYPIELRNAKVEGSVTVEFIVAQDGTVHEPRIVRSTHAGFEEPVLAAITQWRFAPGRRRGQPVNTRAQIDVPFTLAEDSSEPPANSAANSDLTVRDLVAKLQVPTLIEQRTPEFPANLLAARASGRVVVEFQVENTGRVRRACAKSSTNTDFDLAAVEAVRRWKFTASPNSDSRLLITLQTEIDFRITSAATEPPAGEATIHFAPPPKAGH